VGLEVTASTTPLALVEATVVLPIGQDGQLERIAGIEPGVAERLARAARSIGVAGRIGQAGLLPPIDGLAAERFIVVGMGAEHQRSLADVRRGAALAGKLAGEVGASVLAWPIVAVSGSSSAQVAQAIVETTALTSYRFHRYRSGEGGTRLRQLVVLGEGAEVEEGIQRGRLTSDAVCFARDLTNEPANVLDPERLSGIAWEIAQETGLACSVYDRALLEELGAGAILAVGQGSRREPRLIHLVYRPDGDVLGRVALVGKAVTFDSGGLSLKPAEGMERMKGDMAGGAAVLAVLRALPALRLPVEVHGVVAAAENLPDGEAFRPGDILRTLSGKTVEVISTDAEGRLLLADALTFAVQQGADLLVDIATLTGACAVALGRSGSGLFASDDSVGQLILQAANEVGERMWALPLWDDYRELLKSEHADLKNTAGRWGAAINAALFLREFTEGRPWAHLDIAGPAWSEQATLFGPAGATGHGVRTLLRFVELWAERRGAAE
jgi:leucyl aminopeptidase